MLWASAIPITQNKMAIITLRPKHKPTDSEWRIGRQLGGEIGRRGGQHLRGKLLARRTSLPRRGRLLAASSYIMIGQRPRKQFRKERRPRQEQSKKQIILGQKLELRQEQIIQVQKLVQGLEQVILVQRSQLLRDLMPRETTLTSSINRSEEQLRKQTMLNMEQLIK